MQQILGRVFGEAHDPVYGFESGEDCEASFDRIDRSAGAFEAVHRRVVVYCDDETIA